MTERSSDRLERAGDDLDQARDEYVDALQEHDGTDRPQETMSKSETGAPAGVRTFEVEVGGVGELTFQIRQSDFTRFLREAQRDIGAAANNLLLHTCTERERIRTALDEDWGLALQILAPIQEELLPEREVVVKKR